MPRAGIEPARIARQILSLLCLPIPPAGHVQHSNTTECRCVIYLSESVTTVFCSFAMTAFLVRSCNLMMQSYPFVSSFAPTKTFIGVFQRPRMECDTERLNVDHIPRRNGGSSIRPAEANFETLCKRTTFHVKQSDDHTSTLRLPPFLLLPFPRFPIVPHSLNNLRYHGKYQSNCRPCRIASIHAEPAENDANRAQCQDYNATHFGFLRIERDISITQRQRCMQYQ